MNRGYVKIYRSISDSGMMKNHGLFTFWMQCLLSAAHHPHSKMVGNQKVDLLPGQFIFGRKSWAKELGATEKQVRMWSESLQKQGRLGAITRASKFTVFSVLNWDTYQESFAEEGQQQGHDRGQQWASNGPAMGHIYKKERKKEDIQEPPISPTGEVRAKTRRQKTSAPENYTPEFEQLWLVSPARNGMKKGKRVAFEKFWHLTQISRLVTAEYLCERMKKLAPQYGAYARDLVTWLNQCGWEDQAHLPMAAAPYDWRKDCATN